MTNRLTAERIQSFLEKHKDPEDARKFLHQAGFIDEQGNLMPQYQSLKEADQ